MPRTFISRSHAAWLLAASLITALSLLLVFAPGARAQQAPAPAAELPAVGAPGLVPNAADPGVPSDMQQSQIYNDDLEVERGQVLEGDVNVYSGDVVVRRDGRITGNLNVYSGDVEIEAGGRVDGSITAWSGDTEVDGRVDGSIAAMAGDVEIGGAAFVGGDISVMAGHIKQRAGAEVGGNILRGPDIKLPAAPALNLLPWIAAPAATAATAAPVAAGRNGFLLQPLGFVGRTLTGLLLLGLFVGGAAAITAFRPRWTDEIQGVLNRQAALSFATGLIANVLMLAIIGFLYITICLRPPALLLGVGLLAFNVAGMAAVGAEIGGRLSERLSGQWTPTARTALGVFVPGAIIVFLWAVGGCFGFFGNMGALLLGSFGIGAILVKALNLGNLTPGTPATRTPGGDPAGAAGQPAPAAATTAPVSPPPITPAAPAAADIPAARTGDAAPADAAAPQKDAASSQTSSESEPWWVSASTLQESAPVPTETSPVETDPPSTAPTASVAAVPPVAADPAETVPAEALPAEMPPVEPLPAETVLSADFTRIEGIGPKLNQRLHAANIHTFADLVALPPETLAGIFGWTSERLLRTRVIEQAKALAP